MTDSTAYVTISDKVYNINTTTTLSISDPKYL